MFIWNLLAIDILLIIYSIPLFSLNKENIESIQLSITHIHTHTHTYTYTNMQFQILVVLSSIAATIVAAPISNVSTPSASLHATKVNEPMYRVRPSQTDANIAPNATGALL